MKKTTFNVSFDEDKASALVLYLSQKGTTAEAELEKALDALYTKTVPAGVRDFIDMKSDTVCSSAVKETPLRTSFSPKDLSILFNSSIIYLILADCNFILADWIDLEMFL